MPFREDTPFDHLVEVFRVLLAAKRKAVCPVSEAWGHRILNWACRHLEDFIEPEVSVAAYEEAKSRGAHDPRDVKWKDQVAKLKDPGRAMFCYEHVLPVSEMIRRLEVLGPNPTNVEILAIIKRAEMAWILRDEDRELNRLGYRSVRPEAPIDAYREAMIVLQPAR